MIPLSALIAEDHKLLPLWLAADTKDWLVDIMTFIDNAFSLVNISFTERMRTALSVITSKQEDIVLWKRVIHMALSDFPDFSVVLIFLWILPLQLSLVSCTAFKKDE